MRPHAPDQIERVFERIAFDVEFGIRIVCERCFELMHILRAYVTLVGPRMYRNAVCSGIECDACRASDARYSQRARIAQQGYLVEIDAELSHCTTSALKSVQVAQQLTRVQFLLAQIVIDQSAHERLALLLRHGARVVVRLHVEQSLAE